MDAPRFALWSGITQGIGNSGMLLSSSPLALLVDWQGWRAGYVACAGFALLVAALVALGVPKLPPARDTTRPTLMQDARQVLALLVSPGLRPVMVLAFASFAGQFGVRALWGGPWLMEEKGLSRVAAGNVLLVYTLTVIVGPMLNGWLARVWPHRVFLLAAGHIIAGLMLLAMVAGADLPPWWDVLTLSIFGLALCSQIIVFSLVRAAVPEAQTGRALSANNIAFFGGAAILQALSGVAAGFGGTAAGLGTFAVALLVCAGGFLLLQPRRGRPTAA
jgi:predicted MFS family arabinose efflux permease